MRQFYDVKVFLDPPEDMRRLWKIKRDTTKRGYTAEQVLAEMEKRGVGFTGLHPSTARIR